MLTTIICFFAIWIAYVLFMATQILAALIITPLFGLVCDRISFFGLTFIKENGKWRKTKSRFSLICQSSRVVDTTRPIPENADVRSILIDLILVLVQIALTVIIFFVSRSIPVSVYIPGTVRWNRVAEDVFIVNILYSAGALLAFLYVHIISRKSLLGYCIYLQKRMRRGQPLDDTMMLPLSQLPYKHYDSAAKLRYYRWYFMYLLWVGRYNDLREPAYDMTSSLNYKSYIMSDTGNYYDLIYFYSRIEPNRELAVHFMNRMRSVFADDPDANAKRVLAYYAYFVEGDREKARFFTDQAKSLVDVFSIPGMERELERRLVSELDEILKNEGC